MNKIPKVALLAVLLFSAGCAGVPMRIYSGPEKPVNEIAFLTGGGGAWSPIWVCKIDGVYGPRTKPNFNVYAYNDARHGAKLNVQMLPGRHTLELFRDKTIPPVRISFDAAAGKKYFLKEEDGKAVIYENGNKVNTAEEQLQAYVEPERGDTAVIEQSSVFTHREKEPVILLYKIDGKYSANTENYRFYKTWGSFSVRVTPGEHTIEYGCSVEGYDCMKPYIRKVNVEAGKKYSFKGEKLTLEKLGDTEYATGDVWLEEEN